VRVCHEVRGVTVLGAMHRGYLKEVGTYFAQPLNRDFRDPYNCEFCGACVDICPVGALNSRQHKFRARTWEGAGADGLPFCSVGCLLAQVKKRAGPVRPRVGVNNQDRPVPRPLRGQYVNSPRASDAPLLRRERRSSPGRHGAAIAAGRARAPGTAVMGLVSSR
jgi:ferredoxin